MWNWAEAATRAVSRQVATLSWHGHVLSSGCCDGSIWHHDVRVHAQGMELVGHSGEVCGLKWRGDESCWRVGATITS